MCHVLQMNRRAARRVASRRSGLGAGVIAVVLAMLTACGGGGGSSAPANPAPPPPIRSSLFAVVSDTTWDETAVRQVLDTFAFGGHPSDAQIKAWADMDPRLAIDDMLVLTPRHDKLSPPDAYDDIANQGGTLEQLAAHWNSNASRNRIPAQFRDLFDSHRPGGFGVAAPLTWNYAMVARGLNPVRQRIGLWETNYHMAIHQQLGNVNDAQTIRYFDDIVNALARGDSYDQVLGGAAVSSAIAMNYGHLFNVFFQGQFFGNEDFAREYHQLFFGIFGDYDPVEHENVTIPNTARALTGIQLPFANGFFATVPTYSKDLHDPNTLRILRADISGSDAPEDFRALSAVAIEHQESLANLPIMMVAGLADDNLSAADKTELRRAWAAMSRKDALRFIKDYATSPLFHSTTRIKYLNAFERSLTAQSHALLANAELYSGITDLLGYAAQGAVVFAPANNVFGGQRGTDAAASAEVFRLAYNKSVEEWYRYVVPSFDLPDGSKYHKDWAAVMPAPSGGYTVRAVTEWLWQRFLSDGLSNLGTLERAQLYALLSTGLDFASVATNGADPDHVYSASDITGDATLNQLLKDLGDRTMDLASGDLGKKDIANALVGQGINFIEATPYAFVRQGKD